jgi:1-phosphofructokinase
MIFTVTLNPALEKYLALAALKLGGVNRAEIEWDDVGGKGINISRFLKVFGRQSEIAGFFAGAVGSKIRQALMDEGFKVTAFDAYGETRANYTLFEKQKSRTTKLNERGPAVESKELDELGSYIEDSAGVGDLWVFSGSLPKGAPDDYSARLISLVNRKEGISILDAEGAPLLHGVRAVPALLHINREEAERISSRKIAGAKEAIGVAELLSGEGINFVALTLGAQGAVFVHDGVSYTAQPPQVDVKSTVGAGDALVAGLVYGLADGIPVQEMVQSG